MKIITRKFLEERGACRDGIDAFGKKYPSGQCRIDTVVNDCIESKDLNNMSYANWLLTRVFTRKQNLQYAIYAAESVLHIYNGKYPDDDRPRIAVEAVKAVLRKNTKRNRTAADAAADAAVDAADAAADAAVDAAHAAHATAAAYAAHAADAAAHAAYAAFYAADAAAHAAYAAARAAAAAARIELRIKILQYGLTILNGTAK